MANEFRESQPPRAALTVQQRMCLVLLAIALAGCSASPEVRRAEEADRRFRTAQEHGATLREICGLARESARAWLDAASADPSVGEQYDDAKLTAGIYCRRADQVES